MSIEPGAAEIRVLGCLIEKQRTTPDGYPLSVNALRLACNQSTGRDPVVDYDDRTVLDALEQLGRRRWTRLASGAGSRARKYRQLLDRELPASEPEMAVLCVLMLRGPQTPGELKQRTERLHPFADLAAIEDTLLGLIDRELVRGLDRRPGQKERRYEQLLGGAGDEAAAEAPAQAAPAAPVEPDRLGRLEAEVARLRRDLDALKSELGQ
ncbi:MAG TPA: YceH family protein [Thermoleophilaceae bacterium]|nr:YceH family protein [Thermoleophilaceae bacterium]